MTNLKIDLLNELRNKKYYAEIELRRLAEQPLQMKYNDKLELIQEQLNVISTLESSIQLVEKIFVSPQSVQNVESDKPNNVVENASIPHVGQSHGE